MPTIEKAEYAKSDAPKLTPSNTNARELMGWVAATNWQDIHIFISFSIFLIEHTDLYTFQIEQKIKYRSSNTYKVDDINIFSK